MKQKALLSTKVEVECISKKHSKNWNLDQPIQTSIELSVPYDMNSIYYQMSGGTTMVLHTINQEAADMFIIGNKYLMEISPINL